MRSLVVVAAPKAVEGPLLGREVVAGRPGGLGLERAMHPLVATVLIGASRLDADGVDAQSYPPRGES